MNNKKKISIILVMAVALVIIMFIVIFTTEVFTSAEYSNDYNRTFGEFTAKTASELLEDKKENTCYSPVSLFATMTLLAECTEGETRQEILQCLGVENMEELIEKYSKMVSDVEVEEIAEEDDVIITNTGGIISKVDQSVPTIITLCNSLWIDNDYLDNDSDKVIKECEEKLECDIFECEGMDKDEINAWVAGKTNNLISELANGKEEKIALINTCYYRASWIEAFQSVGEQEFALENGNVENVEFMKVKDQKMKFKESDAYIMVSVPLKEGEMVLILPKEGKKLSKLLKEKELNQILAMLTGGEMEEGLVDVTIPKFEIEHSVVKEIEEMLNKLGVKEIYGEDSQWKISEKMNGMPLVVKQNTKMIVNESGIEASAATMASGDIAINVEETILDITFNRPFLYILMKDEVPLFIGTVYNPAE